MREPRKRLPDPTHWPTPDTATAPYARDCVRAIKSRFLGNCASARFAADLNVLHRDTILMSGVANDSKGARSFPENTLQRDFGCGIPTTRRVSLSHPPIPAFKDRKST